MTDRELLVQLFRSAVDSVRGDRAVERSLRESDPGEGPHYLIGAGKAVCAMAAGAVAALGPRVAGGFLTTKHGHRAPIQGPRLEVCEAGHPLPDAASLEAATRALELARRVAAPSRALVLISGGASALWAAPPRGVCLDDLRQLTDLLLRSGADIRALNAIRKHASLIAGGGLTRALARAQPPSPPVLTVLLSDVAGDPLDAIGSGPTAPDPTTFEDAWRALEAVGIVDAIPAALRDHFARGRDGALPETPKPGDPLYARSEYRVVASLREALAAAQRAGEAEGLRVRNLGPVLYGEAVDEARALCVAAQEGRAQRFDLIVAGGEPVVHVRGPGLGGRAQELALGFALEIEDREGLTGLFAGTDGTDGPTNAAGAVVDAGTVARARVAGLDARAELARNNAHEVLQATGDLLVTGPTQTNVNDLALVIARRRPRQTLAGVAAGASRG